MRYWRATDAKGADRGAEPLVEVDFEGGIDIAACRRSGQDFSEMLSIGAIRNGEVPRFVGSRKQRRDMPTDVPDSVSRGVLVDKPNPMEITEGLAWSDRVRGSITSAVTYVNDLYI